MNDTPRTDEISSLLDAGLRFEPIKKVQQLECELNEAKAELKRLKSPTPPNEPTEIMSATYWRKEAWAAQTERDALQKELNEANATPMNVIHSAKMVTEWMECEHQRDAWRKVADELVGLIKMWHYIKNVQPDDDMEAIAAYEKLKAKSEKDLITHCLFCEKPVDLFKLSLEDFANPEKQNTLGKLPERGEVVWKCPHCGCFNSEYDE
jgi:hypothetical protein